MRLWAGNSPQFIEDTTRNQIADKLKTAFFDYYRFNPSPSEINSWRNSLRALAQTFERTSLTDHGVLLEYQLPLTSQRLDCLLCGRDENRDDRAVIIELKQWERCQESHADNEVMTWVGGSLREVLHPSVQVGQYRRYLEDTHTAFHEGLRPIKLDSCAYLHNYPYEAGDVIFSRKFVEALSNSPAFTADQTRQLDEYLISRLRRGEGVDVLRRIEESRYRPSKKLMEHVGNVIKGKPQYVLLDEQLIVYDKVLACARDGFHDKAKVVIIVRGGPGTGKSVIALNLMADLLLKKYNAHYATGSKAFTSTLRKIIGARGSAQFKYFSSYVDAEHNEIDVLIADEAHRIRETSNLRFTPRHKRSNQPQIEELIQASKVLVLFVDDKQVVRPNEIGSADYLQDYARNKGCKLHEYTLEAQFRCGGSEAFVNWINNTLEISRTPNVIWDKNENFDFKVLNSPWTLEQEIRKKVGEGHTGRVAAGFCWDWSMPKPDGTLENDVIVGDYQRPWDAKPGAGRLAPGIPKAEHWAYDPAGIDQIGCVYTAQGFEFDYIGVIFGPDLIYRFDQQSWIGVPKNSADSQVKRSKTKFLELVKNTYRVLFTRGLKGCYVHFMDSETERFFKSRMARVSSATEQASLEAEKAISFLEDLLQDSEVSEKEKFVTALPVYSLAAAASGFSDGQAVTKIGWKRLSLPLRLTPEHFIARVVGKSMEPIIPDGAYCVFKKQRGGSRDGMIVLVESNRITDPEHGQGYTVKKYHSEKELFDDGTWRHKKIILSPENREFKEIILEDVQTGDFQVVAEYVTNL